MSYFLDISKERDRLRSGEALEHNEALFSENGCFELIMQSDGNLVLYRMAGRSALWASNTRNMGSRNAHMQDDGNFVVYNWDSSALWATGTEENEGAYIVLQDDGNLVVYTSDRNVLWASNTVTNC